MVDDGLLKKAEGLIPHFYHLPHIKAYSIQSYKHEKICGDIYLAYQDILEGWNYEESDDFIQAGVLPDRASCLSNGHVVFWEIDRSTMTRGRVLDKLQRYIHYARMNEHEFSVVFACPKRRAFSLLPHFKEYINPRVKFYVADCAALLSDPMGKVFHNPWNKPFSILELT